MTKLLLLAIVIFGAFMAAKAVPEIGFYVFMLIAFVFLIAVAKCGGSRDPLAGSTRTRTRKALRAVRKNHMTLAQASQHYGVPERSIARTHLLFFLFLD